MCGNLKLLVYVGTGWIRIGIERLKKKKKKQGTFLGFLVLVPCSVYGRRCQVQMSIFDSCQSSIHTLVIAISFCRSVHSNTHSFRSVHSNTHTCRSVHSNTHTCRSVHSNTHTCRSVHSNIHTCRSVHSNKMQVSRLYLMTSIFYS